MTGEPGPADVVPPTVRTIPFGDLSIDFDDTVLVPRPWTLQQAQWAHRLLRTVPPGPVLELCTGAGHIGLATVAGTGRRAVLVDRDVHACELARTNAARIEEEVEVRHGDMSAVLRPDEQFALVVADPPWVPSRDVARHPEDPVWAIDGGDDGLDVARVCLEVVSRHLVEGGRAVLQLGSAQQVLELEHDMAEIGLTAARVHQVHGGAMAEIAHLA